MLIDLNRTFTPAKELRDEQDDWLQYLTERDKEKFTWSKLYKNAVVVIVGEAGIGKTKEFENEVNRLQDKGEAAFFVELNQLINKEGWDLSIDQTDYTAWKDSSTIGYFFLDAIDESRLTGHAAFKKALLIVAAELKPNLARIKLVISSRWTDWSQKEVQTAVSDLLVKPIDADLSEFVVSLNPLSTAEAKHFAAEFGLKNRVPFWTAIDESDYWYMAMRPLDLEWLVKLWNQQGKLGNYLTLIKGNVTNRLTETNPNYKTADKVLLSPDKLRRGAEALAAAAEFSGRHYIATDSTSAPRNNEVVPLEVLKDWDDTEVMRLLASAVFDEATYGRVKFHHRSVREYLAACWVDQQLFKGLPFQHAIHLFATAPFGTTELIPNRRWTLCWLATINVEVREWVTENFPEMIAFDGDPESWDELSADRAFTAYLQRLKEGLRTDWFNEASELRRVGRSLPPGRVASLLSEPEQPERIRSKLLSYVKYAYLTDCAEVVFDMYRNSESTSGERGWALAALEKIGTKEQNAAIKNDLLSGDLTTNELIAAALPVIDWRSLTVEQLAGIFHSAGEEDYYSSGSMFTVILEKLLPNSTSESVELLLNALNAVLPKPKNETRFSRIAEPKQPYIWLFKVLPYCYERLLELLPQDSAEFPKVCIDAVEHIVSLRDTGFSNKDELKHLQNLISQHSNLRWQIALEIALSKGIIEIKNLNWHKDYTSNIVSFDSDDLTGLTKREKI